MREVLKEFHIDESELKPSAALGYIGRFKAEAVRPKEAEKDATTARLEQICRVYMRYQKKLQENNELDFDDLILETVRLFHECPKILDRYQETWRYLHVDEYQDTNHAQYLFITLLSQKYRNLCVIGDPNRPKKAMWTERSTGPHIVLHELEHERNEAEEALRAVEEQKQNGLLLNDQVILYRTNAQSRLFEEACMRFGIPYRIVGGVKFYARKEVKDILAYLHLLLNTKDTISLLRIINVPARKLGQ